MSVSRAGGTDASNTSTASTANDAIEVVSRDEWLGRRRELLALEKRLTRERDELARRRRELGGVPVTSDYTFHTEAGPATLIDLFGGRSQLLVYHFMFGPDWEEGCPSCSFWADGYDPMVVHLAHRDVALVAVASAPLDRLLAYRERMGWSFPWVSSAGTTFNADFGVSPPTELAAPPIYNYAEVDQMMDEAPGLSAFALTSGGAVLHTYSCYARGLDPFNAAYQMLDVAPRGRDEDALDWPMAWLRRHDQY
ncbi:MAG: DUF899 domain-containing protein [Acidimicrobiia bacterium]|nr:DUF899 domain-containing protein [Acidimicrobiia bacterium]